MFHREEHFLARALIFGLSAILIALVAFWCTTVKQVDLESVRESLSVTIQVETAFFSLTLAGLAIVSAVLSRQSKRLERVRKHWLRVLVAAPHGVLDEIANIYQHKFQERNFFPPLYKYSKISHLRDAEINTYLPAIIRYCSATANGEDLTSLDDYARDLDSDPMLLFRISCAVFLAEAWDARLPTDPVAGLVRELRNLDRSEHIIILANNIYDSRLAASRGLPVFIFFTLSSIVVALVTLSTLSPTTYSRWLYGIAIFPFIVIVLFSGFYISQILKRYF